MLLSTSGSPGSRRTRGIARSDRPVDPHSSAPFRRFKGGDQQGGTLDTGAMTILCRAWKTSGATTDVVAMVVTDEPWRSQLVRTT